MAFTSTITYYGVEGSEKVRKGTYTSDGGSTGGDIDTGLTVCRHLELQPSGAAVSASANVINETLGVAGNAVTIVTIANETGYWKAYGY